MTISRRTSSQGSGHRHDGGGHASFRPSRASVTRIPLVRSSTPALPGTACNLAEVERIATRHALGRGTGVVRRRALSALERHPQQSHHEVGRGNRRGRACSASHRTSPTATRATGRGGSLTCEHDARRITRTEYDGTISVIADRFEANRSTRPTTSSASPTARSGSPIRRSVCSATTRATSPSRNCRPTCTASIGQSGADDACRGDINRPNGLRLLSGRIAALSRRGGGHAAQRDTRLRRGGRRHANGQ